MRQLDIGYQYVSSAIVADGTPDTDPPGADYAASAAPGRRAPHLWVTVDGVRRSTLDLAEAAWPGLYGVSPAGAVLLRPDRHVAWRASDAPVADGETEFATALNAATGKKMAVA